MTISPNEAQAMLADVDGVVARVKQSQIYQRASRVMMLWGAIAMLGGLVAPFAGRGAGVAWLIIDAGGVAATLAILARSARPFAFPWRYLGAFVLFFAFGYTWAILLGGMRGRELDAFWPTLFLFGYSLAGLWFGRLFTLIGCGLTVLIIGGYFWAPYYQIYLTLVNGVGLILCGYAMRRA